jgi:hypothetical protein
MLKRVEMARNLLSDPGRRDTYRRQTYPDINFEGVEDLLEKKHRALAMQDATGSQAREVRSLINELSRARGKRKPGDSGGP